MKTDKTFESWYTAIQENELATTTATPPATTEAPTISSDVDTIINSLETLAKELTEELDSPEFNELNEVAGEGPSKVWQWMWWMPKAKKAQAKVNKIKLNVTDMEAAAEDAENTEQRSKINAKATQAKAQADELQKLVDDKFNAKGELVQKALHNEKIAGQIASIKRATGLEDDPEKIASYKEKMAELQQKYKEDLAAIKELEPSDEDKAAEKEAKKKEAEEAKIKQDKLNADAEEAKKKAEADKASSSTGEPNTNSEETDTNEPKTDSKVDALENEIKDLEKKLEDAEKSPDKNKQGIDVLKSAIVGKKKSLETLKNKTQESLVNRANAVGLNELATEINSKFDWQVDEGTALYSKYNELIKKAEYSNTLNESRYESLSIKDRFSKLL